LLILSMTDKKVGKMPFVLNKQKKNKKIVEW